MNVLFLTHRLPYTPNRGDRVRAHFLLHHLHRYADVSVVSLVHDTDEAGHANDLRTLASSVHLAAVPRLGNMLRSALALPGRRPTTHSMLDSPALGAAVKAAIAQRPPDVVLAYCSGMARLALAPPLDGIPLLLDMVDVDSAKWGALAAVSPPPMRWIYRREARVLRLFEAQAARRAVANLVVTPRERESLHQIAPDARVEVVANGVDVESLRPRQAPADSATVVFCGVMNYPPNEQAALLLARDVWPLVRRERPDARLQLVGATPSRRVAGLANPNENIVVTGSVPDVRPYLWTAAVATAPIVTARGIQNKVLEAVAAGLPTVVTPNILDSLPQGITAACVSASGAGALAAAIVGLLAQAPNERRAMAARADLAALTWDHQLAPVEGLLREAIARGPSRRAAPLDIRTDAH